MVALNTVADKINDYNLKISNSTKTTPKNQKENVKKYK